MDDGKTEGLPRAARLMLDTLAQPAVLLSHMSDRTMRLHHANPAGQSLAAALADHLAKATDADLSGPCHVDLRLSGRGDTTWSRVRLSRLPDSPDLILGLAVDITDLKQRQANDIRRIAELDAAQRELRRYAGLTAHDMRGPLANVVSLTDLVLDDFVDMGDQKRQMIEMCREVAETSIDAIDAIMARIAEVGRSRKESETCSLGAICDDLVKQIDPGGRLRVDFPRATLTTDPLLLQLALRNLLDNASRYADGQVWITLASYGRRPDMLRLTVTDDGPGMAATQKAKEGVARLAHRGFGLPAMTDLLQGCGGDLIALPDRAGMGASFEILLPGRIEKAEVA